jgi:hypothetical protein
LVIRRVLLNGRVLSGGDVAVTPGRKASIVVELVNQGGRSARAVVVSPSVDAPFVVLETQGELALDDMAPGEKQQVNVSLQVSEKSRLALIVLKLWIAELREKFSSHHEIRIPLRKVRSSTR